jgi:uncharacterized protein YegJ (DUF2314 family)
MKLSVHDEQVKDEFWLGDAQYEEYEVMGVRVKIRKRRMILVGL